MELPGPASHGGEGVVGDGVFLHPLPRVRAGFSLHPLLEGRGLLHQMVSQAEVEDLADLLRGWAALC